MGMSGDEGPTEDLSEGRTRLDATQPRSLTGTLLLMTRTLFKNILQGLLPAHSMLWYSAAANRPVNRTEIRG